MKVIKFFAPWCLPCRTLAPMMERLHVSHPNVDYEEVNIEESEQHQLYGVMSIPTVLLLNGESEVTRLTGTHPASEYEQLFEKAIDN